MLRHICWFCETLAHLLFRMTSVEGPYGLIRDPSVRYGLIRHPSLHGKAVLLVQDGCRTGFTYKEETFRCLVGVVQVRATLDWFADKSHYPQECSYLLLEFEDCSALGPFIDNLCTFLVSQPFERVYLVSHTPCAQGSCLLIRLVEALHKSKALVSITIWGDHLGQNLRLTFTITYCCSYVETHGAQHPPVHDLSLFEAFHAAHYLYQNSEYLSSLSLSDFRLSVLNLASLNLTDCQALPDAILSWLTSNLLKAPTLQSLVLCNNKINNLGAFKIIGALRLDHQNSMLRILDLSDNMIEYYGANYMASTLATNTTLSKLRIGGNPVGLEGFTSIVNLFIPHSMPSCPTNTTLQSLQLDGLAGEAATQLLCDLVQLNTTLTELEIWAPYSFQQSDVVALFKALEKNDSLTSFSLPRCKGVDGNNVYEAITHTLLADNCLQVLNLKDTPIMENPRWSLAISSYLNQQSQMSHLRLPKVQPTTSRVFFCGDGSAGKTTLCRTMTKVLKPGRGKYRSSVSDYMSMSKHSYSRTTGIEVTLIKFKSISISFWDLAGQREYQSFHDLMFPRELGPALFLIVCNLLTNDGTKLKAQAAIRMELEYWLRYISSNSRKLEGRIPHVILVFSHKDKLAINDFIFEWARDQANELRKDFESVARVVDDVFFIDSHSWGDVSAVAYSVCQRVEELLKLCPLIYDLCNAVRIWIDAWIVEHPLEPWLRTEYVIQLVKHEMPELASKYEGRKLIDAVFSCLHDTGHVIFFDQMGVVFLNPGWFCQKFMGGLIDKTAKSLIDLEQLKEGDAWKRKHIESILQQAWKSCNSGFRGAIKKEKSRDLAISDLIQILLKLEVCYELDPGNPSSSLFIPAALQHSSYGGHLKWDSNLEGPCIYVGRRLKCEDEKHTFLTPGFFPRLQVHLQKVFLELKKGFPALYRVWKNIIKIDVDRLEILVEFCEEPITYIDILARSCKAPSQTLKFLRDHLIQNIQKLQFSSGYWQGISLVEGIIRPSCVKNLTPCKRRLDQFVLVDDLQKILLNNCATDIENVTYPWPAAHDLKLEVEHVFIKDLLGEEDFSHVLGKSLNQIKDLSEELNLYLPHREDKSENLNPKWRRTLSDLGGIRSTEKQMYGMVAEIHSMVKDIKIDVKDIKSAVRDLIKQGQMLAPRIEEKLIALLMSTRETKFPRLFVFVKKDRLITDLVPGLSNLNLQFMCEHEGSLHVPPDQRGYDISVIENDTVKKVLPYMKYLLSAVVLGLKVGAHIVGGVGGIVPDVSQAMDSLIQATGLAIDAVASTKNLKDSSESSAIDGDMNIHSGNVDRSDGNHLVKFLIASAWVEEFLSSKGCEQPFQIYKSFGLLKTKCANGRIAWLCEAHIQGRGNDVEL